ncbi:5-dehydro-4-deoxyglucarate dehydratase [Acrocarpospora catenulata]|uniref:5-dehydro-4-deoxyglucarate dehydratase n=1 Tax=Acrocarpospora catenulata TaxID=2836182 RepID=UPI001BDA8D38|nr:5-dehydro-4-deoxyglucarate dehydratase [Acrocarpospora catenulata]
MNLDGVLFFPVTPFDPDGRLAAGVLAEHIAAGVAHGPGGVFVACGTGEFGALAEGEHRQAVQVAIETVRGRVPVVAGAGGPLGAALAQARAAREAGADGLLLMPPYLGVRGGYFAYVRAVAAVGLPVIVYARDAVVLEPDEVLALADIPGVVGLKDGIGDIDRIQRIVLAMAGRPFTFFNGLPTAELTMPAYRALGVTLYSSAVYAFAPEIALAYYHGNPHLLTGFYEPLVRLRGRVPGYAVALVKAGVRLRGLDVGPVRPPLTDLTPEHLAELDALIKTGLDLL